ncbi:hypothetical protein JCM16303_006846 [Sporobolomyces ruberrimus]
MDSSYCVDQLVELILMPDTSSSPEQHLDRVRSLLEDITSDKIDSTRTSSPPNLLYSISDISPLEALLSLPTSLTTSPTTFETLKLLLSKGSDPLAANQAIFDAYFEKAKNSESDVHEGFVKLTGLILERIREAREEQEEVVVPKTEGTLPLPPTSRASPSRATRESSHHGSVDVPKPSSRSTSDSDKAQPQRPRIRLYITLPPCTSPASLVDYFYQALQLEINIVHVQMSTSPPCFAFVDVDEQLWLEGEILKRVEWGRVSKPFLGGAGRSWALVLRLAIPRRYEQAVANVVPSFVQQAQSSAPSVQAPLSRLPPPPLPPLPPPPPRRLPPSPLALSSPDYNPPGTTSVISPVHTPISNPVPNAPSYSPHPGFHFPAYCLTPDGPSSSYSPFSPSPSLAHLDSPRSASPLPADSPTCPSLSLVIPDPALPHTPPQTLPLPARKEEPSETLVPEKTHDRDGWIRLTLEGLPFDSTTHSSVETLLSRFLNFWKDLEIVRDDRRYRLQAQFSVKGEKTVQSLEKQVATWVLAGQKLLVTRVKIKESIEIKDEVFDSKLEAWEELARGMMAIEEEEVGPKLEVKEEPDESNVGLFESQVRDDLVGLESQREDGECSMDISETSSGADASELKNSGRSPSDEIERDRERDSRKRRRSRDCNTLLPTPTTRLDVILPLPRRGMAFLRLVGDLRLILKLVPNDNLRNRRCHDLPILDAEP